MAKKNTGPEMFKDLTGDESWVLRMKLNSGASASGTGLRDWNTSAEIHDISTDLHEAYEKYLKGTGR